MAKAAVGAARIEMSVNSATFERQMERARKATTRFSLSTKNLSRKFDKVGKKWQRAGKSLMQNITAPLAGAGIALVALQKKTGDAAGELLDMAASTGMSTKALQEYKFALGEAGIEVDMMQRLMERNNQRMGRALDGNKNFADTYDRLGVSLRKSNGELRSSEAVFDDVLRALAGIEDGATRAAIAGDLLGTNSGRKLAGALSGGIGAMEEARKKAHQLGLVLDQDALESADRFGIKMDRLKEQITASSKRFAIDLIPVVENKLIPMFEKALKRVQGLTKKFTDLDTESQKRILKIVGYIGLLPPVIFAVGTAFIGIAATISTLLTPIGAVIAAIGGLGAAVIYIWDNWKAVKERISDISWWRNAMIKMLQIFLEYNTFGLMIKGFNAMMRHFGQAEIPNPFTALAGTLEGLKTETKEYEHQFGDFTESILNAISKITGLDLPGLFNKQAAAMAQTMEEKFGKGIGMYRIDTKINPPDRAQLANVPVSGTMYRSPNPEKLEQLRNKAAALDKRLRASTQSLNFFNKVANDFTSSFGDGLTNLIVQGGRLNDIFNNMKRLLLSSAVQKGLSALLTGGLGGAGFLGAGGGIFGAIGKLFNVNDALLRSDGSVVRFHPDDDILAMKDFGDLGKQFSNQSTPYQMNNRPQQAHVSVQINGREVVRAIEDIYYKYSR